MTLERPNGVDTAPVSVVIPYFNSHRYVDDALKSVRRQTLPPAEIIIVDNGSTAESAGYLDRYADIAMIVRLSRNSGPGIARNAGVARATQPLIAFLDADDAWTCRKLEAQVAFMAADPAIDLSHTGAFVKTRASEFPTSPRPAVLDLKAALAFLEVLTPSIIVRREAFLSVGGFDPAVRYTEDWDFQVRFVRAGHEVRYLDENLLRIRRVDDDHLSADWRVFLRGHVGLTLRFRSEYVGEFGTLGWIAVMARELARAGRRAPRILRTILTAPYRSLEMVGVTAD